MKPDDPTVGVIMRSKDEQPYTEPTLAMLTRQTYTRWTLYNIDSGSTDGTLEVVERYNSRPERLVRIKPSEYVPGPVLNRMCAMTTEPIIVFLNADAIPQDEEWLETLLRPVIAGEADGTMSKQLPRADAEWIVKYDYERAYDPANIRRPEDLPWSAVACAFRRELWERHEFYSGGYAEDLEWARAVMRNGARLILVTDSVVEHSHNYTIKGLYRKKFRHGVAYVHIDGVRPHLLKQVYGWLRETVRDLLCALRRGKWLTIPYNLLYRATIHLAFHRGKREGVRRYVAREGTGG